MVSGTLDSTSCIPNFSDVSVRLPVHSVGGWRGVGGGGGGGGGKGIRYLFGFWLRNAPLNKK